MKKVEFMKKEIPGEVYRRENELTIHWNNQERRIQKVGDEVIYLMDDITYEGETIKGFKLGKEKIQEIKQLKQEAEGYQLSMKQPTLTTNAEQKKLMALVRGLERKERRMRGEFQELKGFMNSWMNLLARNLKDLEKDLVGLTRKFARLEMKAQKAEAN